MFASWAIFWKRRVTLVPIMKHLITSNSCFLSRGILPLLTIALTVIASTLPVHAQSQADLEKKFKESLSDSFMIGRWAMVSEGKLGQDRDEKYTINDVRKGEGEKWIITARMQFGNVDVNVPVPVDVKWAGDTPVISITNLSIPGVGTYSARVLVYENTYAGTWSGGDHGGLMNGVVEKQPKTDEK